MEITNIVVEVPAERVGIHQSLIGLFRYVGISVYFPILELNLQELLIRIVADASK